MDRLGTDFDATGSVMTREKLEDQRRKRGECVTCGRKCFQKKLFKMIPINDHGKVLNGRCLNCNPLDASDTDTDGMLPAVSRPATREEQARFKASRKMLRSRAASTSLLSTSAAPPPPTRAGGRTYRDSRSTSRNHLMSRSASAAVMMTTDPRDRSQLQLHQPMSQGSRQPFHHSERTVSNGSLEVSSSGPGMTYPSSAQSVQNSSMNSSSGQSFQNQSMRSIHSGASVGSAPYDGASMQQQQVRGRRASTTGAMGGGVVNMEASTYARNQRPSMHYNPAPPPESAYHQDSHYGRADQYDDYNPKLLHRAQSGDSGSELNFHNSGNDSIQFQDLDQHAHSYRSRTTGNGSFMDRSQGSFMDDDDDSHHAYDSPAREPLTPSDSSDFYRHPYQDIRGSRQSIDDNRSSHDSSRSFNSSHHSRSRRRDSNRSAGSQGSSSYNEPRHHHDNLDEYHGSQSHPLLDAHVESRNRRHHMSGSDNSIGASSIASQRSCGMQYGDMNHDQERVRDNQRFDSHGRDVEVKYLDILKMMSESRDSADSQYDGLHQLSELHLTPEDSEELLRRGAMQLIVDAMFCFPDDKQIQLFGCRSMWNTSGIPDTQHNFVEVGALEIISQDMERFASQRDIQEQALAVLANLGALEANLDLMVEKGVVTLIIDCMNKHSEAVSVQVKGCLCIANMASHPTSVKKSIQELGGGGAVVISMVMHPNDPVLQEKALRALRNLSANCDENKVELTNIGGVDAVISAMQVHRDSAGVQEAGAWTLSNLAGNPDCKSLIGEIGGIDVLIRAMWVHSDNVSVMEWCCRALFILSLDRHNSLIVLEVGGISAIVNAMQAHVDSSVVQEMGCGILGNLPTDDKCKTRIVEEEALDAIVLAMVLYTDTVEVQERACQVLLQLAIRENLKAMHASNVVELVRASSEKFPENCGDLAEELRIRLDTYVEEYG